MGSHQSARMLKDEWLTPPDIIKGLGSFDLDPCSPVNRPWDTADRHYTIEDDGLMQPWSGRVWLNPPYGREATAWLDKLGGMETVLHSYSPEQRRKCSSHRYGIRRMRCCSFGGAYTFITFQAKRLQPTQGHLQC